jgi:hypothetical protein
MFIRNFAIIALAAMIPLAGCAPSSPLAPTSPPLASTAKPVKWIEGPRLRYPVDMWRQGMEGTADIDCILLISGTTKDCIAARGTTPSFMAAALDFVSASRWAPQLENGVPIEEPHHIFHISFAIHP